MKPDSAGNFAISVFKQHNGVLVLDPSVKRKGLVSGSAVLPGLAQYAYGAEGIKLINI